MVLAVSQKTHGNTLLCLVL